MTEFNNFPENDVAAPSEERAEIIQEAANLSQNPVLPPEPLIALLEPEFKTENEEDEDMSPWLQDDLPGFVQQKEKGPGKPFEEG